MSAVVEPLLELQDVTVHYRRGRTTICALDAVNLDVRPGETVGLVGESGSGKSTIGRAVLGLAPIRSGEVRLAGRDITHLSFKQRRSTYQDVQVVFQDPYSSLNPSRTIGGTLSEPLEAQGGYDRAAVRDRVREALERVRLPAEAADRYPRQFSGGQRQRIAIARALILSPQLIVFDEPTSALDLSVQAQILNLLQELQAERNLSYLFISHDLQVVRHVSDRVFVLYQGQVLETGRAAEVSEGPAHPYAHALLQAAPLPNPRLQRERRAALTPSIRLESSSSTDRCAFAHRCPYAIPVCESKRPELRPSEHGLVACHRYPEWCAEAAPDIPVRNGGPS